MIDEYVLGGLELLHSKISKLNSPSDIIEFMNDTLMELQDTIYDMENKKTNEQSK